MSTRDYYIRPTDSDGWEVQATGAARLSWEYDDGRERLLALYQKGKDKQWDAQKRIDWSLEVDPYDALGLPDEAMAIYGTKYWDKFGPRGQAELRRHYAAWQFSQFLHGEQGAMVCAARIVESVPDLDSKFYSATQTMDEARHAEMYARFLQEKIGMVYPINDQLQSLLKSTLNDSRWDMPYLGMQVLIEGLALAAFGLLRDTTTKPLPKQLLSYVMQDGELPLPSPFPASAVQPDRPVRQGHRALEREASAGVYGHGGVRAGRLLARRADAPGRRAGRTA